MDDFKLNKYYFRTLKVIEVYLISIINTDWLYKLYQWYAAHFTYKYRKLYKYIYIYKVSN